MNLADILQYVDSLKRQYGGTLSDIAADPRKGLLGVGDRLNQGARDWNRDMMSQMGGLLSVRPEVQEQSMEGLLGVLPTPGGTFAGVGAKTANKAALAKAQAMTQAGTDPADVWKATGWTDQFPDGKWRFEIPDNSATLKNSMLADVERGAQFRNKNPVTEADIRAMRKIQTTWPAQDAMAHPTLWKSYPDDVAHYPVSIDDAMGSKGAFSGTEKSIGLAASSEKDMQSTLLHELQHAVQQREGFAMGGSPEGLSLNPEMFNTKIKQLKEAVENQAQNAGGRVSELYRKAYNGSGLNFKEAGEFEQLKKALPAFSDLQKELDKMRSGRSAYELYRSLAGEAEARLTQSRMNLTPAERAARPPWLEFDVPREQQIVGGLLP